MFGLASGATIVRGVQVVESGGTANGTVIQSGGTLEVLRGAAANGFTINSGGVLEVGSGEVVFGKVTPLLTTKPESNPLRTSAPPAKSCGATAVPPLSTSSVPPLETNVRLAMPPDSITCKPVIKVAPLASP